MNVTYAIVKVYIIERNDVIKCHSNVITIWRTSATEMTTLLNQSTDSPKSLLACKVLMECCVSSMQFYTIHAKKIDDIPMLPILYDKMELYGIYQASGHCTS